MKRICGLIGALALSTFTVQGITQLIDFGSGPQAQVTQRFYPQLVQ